MKSGADFTAGALDAVAGDASGELDQQPRLARTLAPLRRSSSDGAGFRREPNRKLWAVHPPRIDAP